MDETNNQNQPSGAPGPENTHAGQPTGTPQSTAPAGAPMQNPDPGGQPAPEPKPPKVPMFIFVALALIAVIVLMAMVIRMGDEDASQQPQAASPVNEMISSIDPNTVVATVNGEEIRGSALRTSINQIAATAQMQGIDVTDPNVQADIQDQAVQVLVNTELLEQEAAERDITVADADVDARIAALISEVGSEELLNERMSSLGIDNEMLVRDVRSELVIQALLDEVFADADTSVTAAEVDALYETSVSGADDAPALEEIRPQIEEQIQTSKEQAALDAFISQLRTDADVEVVE